MSKPSVTFLSVSEIIRPSKPEVCYLTIKVPVQKDISWLEVVVNDVVVVNELTGWQNLLPEEKTTDLFWKSTTRHQKVVQIATLC